MTENDKERKQLARLADALAHDTLEAPDDEILADFTAARGDPAAYAADMQARFQQTLLAANKARLRAAKAGAAAASVARPAASVTDIAEARRVLRQVLASPAAGQMMLAARNERELSDGDVLGLIEDLRELGLWPYDDGEPA